MKINVVELSPFEKRIDVEIPVEDVNAAYENALAQFRKRIKVPGFRPGKVPRKVIEQRYGEALREETTKNLLEESSQQALIQTGEEPVVYPKVHVDPLELGKPFAFNIQLEVMPKVTLEGLDDLSVEEVEEPQVSEEEVEQELNELRLKSVQIKPAEGKTKPEVGDQVFYEFSIAMGDEEPSPVQDRSNILGEGGLIPEMEELLLSMSIEETGETSYQVPEDHKDKEIAGKTVRIVATLKEIKERVLPELDDEFAKDHDADSLEELRGIIRTKHLEAKEKQKKEDIENNLIQAILERNDVPVPPSLIQMRTEAAVRETTAFAKQVGLSLEDMDMHQDTIIKDAREHSIKSVKRGIILDSVARQEGFEVSDDEVDAQLRTIAEENKVPEARVKAAYAQPERIEGLKQQIVRDKALAFLVSKATIKTKSESETEG